MKSIIWRIVFGMRSLPVPGCSAECHQYHLGEMQNLMKGLAGLCWIRRLYSHAAKSHLVPRRHRSFIRRQMRHQAKACLLWVGPGTNVMCAVGLRESFWFIAVRKRDVTYVRTSSGVLAGAPRSVVRDPLVEITTLSARPRRHAVTEDSDRPKASEKRRRSFALAALIGTRVDLLSHGVGMQIQLQNKLEMWPCRLEYSRKFWPLGIFP